MIEVGSQIKELREAKKMTQKELAEILNVTPQAISKWERNKSYPDLDTLVKLSKYFQVSTDKILGNAKPPFFVSLFSKKKEGTIMTKEIGEETEKIQHQATKNNKIIAIFSITANLISDGGFQTQRLVTKMKKLVNAKKEAVIIEMYSSNKVNEKGRQVDIILLTPEFGFIKEELEQKFPTTTIHVISNKDYAFLNAEKVLKEVLSN